MARVIICGERFGIIRDAFLARGHDAMSCDLLPSESNRTRGGGHYQGDARDLLDDGKNVQSFSRALPKRWLNSGAAYQSR